MVTLGRFELPTCGLGNRRSIHLSYRATEIILTCELHKTIATSNDVILSEAKDLFLQASPRKTGAPSFAQQRVGKHEPHLAKADSPLTENPASTTETPVPG
jgi:hypothetical protein